MREFTPTEINLCKKIAEKEVKEIQYGVWVAKEKRKTIEVSLWNLPIGVTEKQRKEGKWTPLWQEHDCLEWLKKHKWRILDVYCGLKKPKDGWNVAIIPWDGKVSDIDGRRDVREFEAHTFLEALLRAVLAVMEEK